MPLAKSSFLKKRAKGLVWVASILFSVALVVVPVYLLVKYSVSDSGSINTGGAPIPLWPYAPTLRSFTYLFTESQFYGVIVNSIIIALATVFCSMLLGVPAAYVLGRYRVPFRRTMLLGLISVRLFPDISSVIPITEFFIRFGLQNSYLGAVLGHTLLALPYVIFIGMSAFESIPSDLEQQAQVMGAGGFTIFFKILLPLSIPGLIAAAIYTFLLSWDEFIFSYFLLGLGKISTLTLFLRQKLAYAPPQNLLAAISVFISVPVIAFSLALQKYMTAGYTSGSVK